MTISIAIVTYQRHNSLKRCLESLAQQEHLNEKVDIIIIDNGSVPPISSLITDQLKKQFSVKIVRNEKNLGVGRARNQAYLNSKGNYLFFIDDDYELKPNTLEQCALLIHSNDKKSIYHFKIESNRNNFWVRFSQYQYELFVNGTIYGYKSPKTKTLAPITANSLPVGAACLIPKEVFQQTNGYRNELTYYGEDSDFSYRINKTVFPIVFHPNISIFHHHRNTFKLLIIKSFTHGKHLFLYQKYYPLKDFKLNQLKGIIIYLKSPLWVARNNFRNSTTLEEKLLFPILAFFADIILRAAFLFKTWETSFSLALKSGL